MGDQLTDSNISRPPARSWLAIGAGFAITLYVVLSIVLILQLSPIAWDEATYALRARHLVEGITPAFYWEPYRAPGLPFVLQLAWITSATEPYLRLITATFGIPLLLSTMFIGYRMLGLKAAIIATIGVTLTPGILLAATQVWPDVPGAAIGFTAIALYVYALDRPVASAWMLGVPLITFAATMLRFGAPIPIAIGLLGITLWRWQVALSSRILVLATALLTALAGYLVLYVPTVTGWAQFGEAVDPMSAMTSLTSRNDLPWYKAFIDYPQLAAKYFSGTTSLLLAVGLVVAVVYAVRRSERSRDVWIALGIGIATYVALGLALEYGEVRYLSPAIPWMWIAAAYGLEKLIRAPDKTLTIAIAVVLTLFVSVDSFRHANERNISNTIYSSAAKAAGTLINDATVDNECGVVARYITEIGWYSHCPTASYNQSTVATGSGYFGDGPTYLVVEQRVDRQPEGMVLDNYLPTLVEPVGTVGGPTKGQWKYFEIWLIEDPDQ